MCPPYRGLCSHLGEFPLHPQAESSPETRSGVTLHIERPSTPMSADTDSTGLLQAWSRGDASALDDLAPLVHLELRQMARRLLSGERSAVGWQPTELVQESVPAAARLADGAVGEPGALLCDDGAHDAAGARRRGAGAASAPSVEAVAGELALDGADVAAPELRGRRRRARERARGAGGNRPEAESGRRAAVLRRVQHRRDSRGAGRVGADRDERLEHRARLALSGARRAARGIAMNAERWQELSTWHNAWLAADPTERAAFARGWWRNGPSSSTRPTSWSRRALPSTVSSRRRPSCSPRRIWPKRTGRSGPGRLSGRTALRRSSPAAGWATSTAPPT